MESWSGGIDDLGCWCRYFSFFGHRCQRFQFVIFDTLKMKPLAGRPARRPAGWPALLFPFSVRAGHDVPRIPYHLHMDPAKSSENQRK